MRVVALLLAAGCNQVLGLDETVLPIKPDAIGCSGQLFGSFTRLGPAEPARAHYDGQLSLDGLELWFVAHHPNDTDGFRAFRSVRPSVDVAFETAEFVDLAAGRPVIDPALTEDGLRIMFPSNAGDQLVYEATRAGRAEAFGAPALVVGLFGPPGGIESLDLSVDGLTAYYADREGELWTAHRPALDEPFQDAKQLFGNAIFPTVSPDQLEIFYNPKDDPSTDKSVVRRVRTSTTEPFAPGETVIPGGGDPDVAPDGRTMVITVTGTLTVVTRECR